MGVDSLEPLVEGLVFPARLPQGRRDFAIDEQWVALVGVLMARGLRGVARMRQALSVGRENGEGPSHALVKRWMGKVVSRYSAGLSIPEREEGRGLLIAEMNEASSVAWGILLKLCQAVDKGELPLKNLDKTTSILSQIVSINKQKATLYGLDKLRVDLQRFDATLDLNKMVDVTNKFGLGPVGLKAVGDCIAEVINEKGSLARKKEVKG